MFPDLLDQKDQPASADTAFITPEVVEKIVYGISDWKGLNTESLGQLWLNLFKYALCKSYPLSKVWSDLLGLLFSMINVAA